MEPSSADISVIISAEGSVRETLACVRSILRFGPKPLEMIITSHNSSADDIRKIKNFISLQNSIQLVQYPATFSQPKVRNLAAKKTRRKLLFFITDSDRFYRGSTGLLTYMAERASTPKTGAVGCLVLARDKKTIRHAGVFKLPNQPFHVLYSGYRLSQAVRHLGARTFPYDTRYSRAVLAVAGPILVSRSVFKSANGFDEKYGLNTAQATVELCLRLAKAKKTNWYCAGGSILDYSVAPKHFIDLPVRLSIIETTSRGDPSLPKLTEANLRVPRANQTFMKEILAVLRRKPKADIT